MHRSRSKSKERSNDRYIPSKISSDLFSMYVNDFYINDNHNKTASPTTKNSKNKDYYELLKKSLSPEYKKSEPVFSYSKKSVIEPSPLKMRDQNIEINNKIRRINPNPYKILDAPNLMDDFYLNLLDWSAKNLIAVGLANELYTLLPSTNKTQIIDKLPPSNYFCSVSFTHEGDYLSMGTNEGEVKIFDLNKEKFIFSNFLHSERIGSLAWNACLLASGSRDNSIKFTDFRSNKLIAINSSHKQEICGLKWSPNDFLLASGGNDNKISLFDLKKQAELAKLHNHTAAVKALAFPHQNPSILISGGGSSDRTIRKWNINTLIEEDVIDTGSQVCNLIVSKTSEEIVSTHGFSLNQINVHKLKNLEKIGTLLGHSMRVLYLAGSPDGENIVTGTGDETLRFWNVFERKEGKGGVCGQRLEGIR